MSEELLTRIAVALESINAGLESISDSLSDASVTLDSIDKTLDKCTCMNGKNSFLCITGNIMTN